MTSNTRISLPGGLRNPAVITVSGAIALSIVALLGCDAALAKDHSVLAEQRHIGGHQPPSPLAGANVLAQVTADSILYFETDNYVVNLFTEGGQTLMNVYDAGNDITRLQRGSVAFTVLNGQATYISNGSYSGRQARYSVSVPSQNQARLIIRDGSDVLIANEPALRFAAFRVPPDQLNAPQRNDVLSFETSTYSVRVFRRNGERFMNVYNKFTALTEVNGQAANVAPNTPPYERAVSYVASGSRSGQPVTYYARIDGSGFATLEIYDVNGLRIFQEPAEGPITVNIPREDLPQGLESIAAVESAFIAVVFGDATTLNQVRQLFPGAFIDTTRQGQFINAGAFANRDAATARVFELRSRGFNARVVFRDVLYR